MFWTIAAVLALIPAILWYLIDPGFARFSSIPLAITSVGQLAGLMGLALFAYNIFISARFKFQEKLFGPQNRIYINHHLLGAIVWTLILIHPAGLLSTYGVYLLLPNYGNWARNLGLIAFLSLNALLIITFHIKLPYHIWRFTHKFMGVVFMMGAVHSLFVSTDIAYYLYLKIYVIFLLIVATLCYLYRTVLGQYFVKRSPYLVQSVTPIAGGSIIEIKMTPQKQPLVYSPGQFFFVTFDHPTLGETHPFSISSAPTDPYLSFSAKALGDWTNQLATLPVNTPAKIEGPFGRFSYTFSIRPRQIWVAGGIGITPFLSMAKALPTTGYDVDLYYVVKTASEAVYLDYFQKLANPCIKIKLHSSDTMNRLTGETIATGSGDLTKSDIYVCGPPPMMKSLREQLNKLGVRHAHIHTEEFSLN